MVKKFEKGKTYADNNKNLYKIITRADACYVVNYQDARGEIHRKRAAGI